MDQKSNINEEEINDIELDFLDMITNAEKSLYPKDVIPMLTDLFLVIGEEFDQKETLKNQLGGRKKEDYEKMLEFLHNLIKKEDIENLDGSTRYVLSKSIEKEIFKNLDFFYYYNLYNDEERRFTKEKIDEILFKVYESLEDEDYLLPDEIKLFIDGEEISGGTDKILDGLNSIKKNKVALSLLNIKYNQFLQKHFDGKSNEVPMLLPEIIQNVDDKIYIKPVDKKLYFQDLSFILKDLESKPIEDLEEKLFYFLSEQPYYYLKKGRLRQYENDTKLIFDLHLDKFTRIDNRNFSYGVLEFLFSEDIKYYDSLNIDGIKKDGNYVNISKLVDKISEEELIELIKNQEVEKNDNNFNKIYSSVLIKELNVNGRIYKNAKEIYKKLSYIENDMPIIVKFEDGKEILAAKGLDYFIFFYNKTLIKTIKYKMIQKPVEDKIIFKYYLGSLVKFSKFIETFFQYVQDDYKYEFQGEKIVYLQANGFNKGDIKKYDRNFKFQLDYLENKTNFNKLLKNLS